MSSRSSVDKAHARCLVGHRITSCRVRLRFSFFVPRSCNVDHFTFHKILISLPPTAKHWLPYLLWKVIHSIKRCHRITAFIRAEKVYKVPPWYKLHTISPTDTLIWSARALVQSKYRAMVIPRKKPRSVMMLIKQKNTQVNDNIVLSFHFLLFARSWL